MVRILLFSLFLVAPLPAFSQAASVGRPGSVPSATPTQNQPDVVNCLAYYPAEAVSAGLQGITVLSAHLLTDGTVGQVHVVQSSGHEVLDGAAVTCLSGKHVRAKTQGGVPIELDLPIQVEWRISAPVFPGGESGMCDGFNYPPMAVRLNHQGNTRLSFEVAKDGTVKDIAVVQSAGYPELDNAAIACIARSRYLTATQNGKPVEYDRQAEINWRLR